MSKKPTSAALAEHLVVIGSSAGGIDALSTLVERLPADFAAPILLVQHLDPRRESHLAEILARRAAMKVRGVARRTRLVPGTIYVIPADRQVLIRDHTVETTADGALIRPSPSIDQALSSAAESYGEGVVAVILTGAGSDGATGARYVKSAGGTVVIQNPETATYPWMPLSLSPTTVDIVVDLEALPDLLRDLVSGEYLPARADDEQALNVFLERVRERTGIDFAQYKRPTILRRLQRRLAATRSQSLNEYMRLVERDREELARLSNSFLIKVTQFFRDPDLYTHLRERIVPELISAAAEHGDEVRLWSAGCATGEEAYSLAIVAAEALRDRENPPALRIFATDVDALSVDFARRGIYPHAALESVPDDLRDRYFTDVGGQFEVDDAIRSLIAFGEHDLAERAPFPRIDMVICRNVLIYFTQELQRRTLRLFAFSLRDSGYLVLGKAETTSALSEHFVLVHSRTKVYRRRGSRVALASGRADGSMLSRVPDRPIAPQRRAHGALTGAAEDARIGRTLAARADAVLMRLPTGVVLIDRKYDIVSINAAARNLLGVHGAAIGQDLIHQVHGIPSTQLRRDVDTAFRGEPAVSTWEIAVLESTSGERMTLETLCYRHTASTDGSVDLVAITVRDVTRERQELQGLQSSLERETASARRLTEQVEQMAAAAARLREANAELVTVNSELRTHNEELLVSNEEVQAATEEVETLNEEMQATNEELETLNEELQATVEELNTTNDDLEARSDELHRLATSLEQQRELSEAERARLSAILAGMGDAVVVVDADADTVLTNDAFDTLFAGGGPSLEDEQGGPIARDQEPWRRAARGEAFVMRFAVVADEGRRRWYEASSRPIEKNGVAGGVVVIRDVTDRSLQQLQQEFVAMLSHELRTPLTGVSAYLELIERELRDGRDARLHRYAERALTQVQRFAGLVDELFDANRLRTGHVSYRLEEVELRPILEAAIMIMQPLADDRPIALHLRTRAKLVANADAERLEQVFINLLSNAVRHAPGTDEIEVTIERDGDTAIVSVRDHGPGISTEERERIMAGLRPQHASASKDGGLGLGLSIARSIVEAHGGSLALESTPGEGATFAVRIPLLPRRRRAG